MNAPGSTRSAPPVKLLVGSALLLSVLVVVAVLASPWMRQEMHLLWLTTDDPQRQQQALRYLIRHVEDEPALVERSLRRVRVAEDADFLRVVAALDAAGRWTPADVPAEAWLRYAALLSLQDDAEARLSAIDHLLQRADLGPDDVVPVLTALSRDDDADVRLAALLAIGQRAGATSEPPSALVDLLASTTEDPEPLVQRHAWLLLGVLRAAQMPPSEVQDPDVRPAALWAVSVTSPSGVEFVRQQGASPHPAAAYALAAAGTIDPLFRWVGPSVSQAGTYELLAAWRAALGLAGHDTVDGDLRAALQALREQTHPPQPLRLALLHALGDPALADPGDPQEVLAALEGASPGTLDVPIPRAMSSAHRLAAIAANRVVSPDDLYPVLRHGDATVRDRAAVLAADRLEPGDAADLARRLLREPDIESQMGGAVLAGLLGVHGEVLRARLFGSPEWPAGPVLQLGLWMQDRPPVDMAKPSLMLLRSDLPRSTVLLAMLHHGDRQAALDALLGPHGEPMLDLPDLLVHRRWWNVLHRYFPDEAPPIWYWADARLTALQLDILRDTWVVRRGRP